MGAAVGGAITRIRQEWTVPGTVVRVVDGDTLVADLDLGWGITYHEARVRLADVNCPEKNTPQGVVAAARTAQLLPAGTAIQVISHKRDKYGRVLATVLWQRLNNATLTRFDLGRMLLSEGLAVPFMVDNRDSDPPV